MSVFQPCQPRACETERSLWAVMELSPDLSSLSSPCVCVQDTGALGPLIHSSTQPSLLGPRFSYHFTANTW